MPSEPSEITSVADTTFAPFFRRVTLYFAESYLLRAKRSNAVIYARYSSDSQREESIDGQLRECKVFAEKNGMTVLRSVIPAIPTASQNDVAAFEGGIILRSRKAGFICEWE